MEERIVQGVMDGVMGSRGWALLVRRGIGLYGCIIFFIRVQGLGVVVENLLGFLYLYFWIYLGMDFCCRVGKGLQFSISGQRVEVLVGEWFK